MKYTLQYASNFFLNLHKRRDFQNMLVPVSENLAILGNISSLESHESRIVYSSFLEYLSSRWKNVYLVPGPYEYCSIKPKPFYDLYTELTSVRHPYKNVLLLNNSMINLPKTNINLLGSTLWTKSPYHRHPCCYEFSYIHKHTKHGTMGQMLGNDFKEWFHEDITHIKDSLQTNENNKSIILTHHLPSLHLTSFTIKDCMEGSNLENMFKKSIPIWLGGAGNKSITGTFNDTFCGVNTYTTFDRPQLVNPNYNSKAFVSLK